MFCAGQYRECACYGKIRWGIDQNWVYIHPAIPSVALRIQCQIGKQPGLPELVDMKPGDPSKHCECQARNGQNSYGSLGLWLLMLADLYLRFIVIWCDLHICFICLNDFLGLWPIVNSRQQHSERDDLGFLTRWIAPVAFSSPSILQRCPRVCGTIYNLRTRVIKCPHFSHHPTIRYMVY